MGLYQCQLIHMTEGAFSSRVRAVPVGDPVAFDVDLGQGGEHSIREVAYTLFRQVARGDMSIADCRLRILDMETHEFISDFGIVSDQ